MSTDHPQHISPLGEFCEGGIVTPVSEHRMVPCASLKAVKFPARQPVPPDIAQEMRFGHFRSHKPLSGRTSATKQERLPKRQPLMVDRNGRDDWIRTSDLTHPKRARYQAAPRPVFPDLVS